MWCNYLHSHRSVGLSAPLTARTTLLAQWWRPEAMYLAPVSNYKNTLPSIPPIRVLLSPSAPSFLHRYLWRAYRKLPKWGVRNELLGDRNDANNSFPKFLSYYRSFLHSYSLADVPPQPLLPTTYTKMCQYSKSVHSREIMTMYIFRTEEHSVINPRAHKQT